MKKFRLVNMIAHGLNSFIKENVYINQNMPQRRSRQYAILRKCSAAVFDFVLRYFSEERIVLITKCTFGTILLFEADKQDLLSALLNACSQASL